MLAWGDNYYGQSTPPPGLSHVIAVAAGAYHSLALKNDSTVVGWGYDYYGQSHVPADLSNVVAIAAGWSHSLALKSDRTVVSWGQAYAGENTVSSAMSNIVAITAGGLNNLALTLPAPTLPTLVVNVSSHTIVFMWPTNEVGFSLEQSTDWLAHSWSPVSPAPTILGRNYTVTNMVSNGTRFYRLRKL